MPQEVKVLNGQNIFDLVNNTYKDLNLTYKFIQENPQIDSINFDFDSNSNVVVSYDPTFSIPLPAPLNQNSSATPSPIKTLKLQQNQSAFDACLMTYGNLENLYKLLQDSGIDSINETDLAQRTLTYDSDLIEDNALYNSVKGNGFRFATHIQVASDIIIPTSFTLRSLFADGHSWRFTCDDTGMLLMPGEDLGIVAGFDTEFILECEIDGNSWRFFVDDTGMLSSESQGFLSGQAAEKILRSIGPDAHKWSFKVDTTGAISQPGTDLGL